MGALATDVLEQDVKRRLRPAVLYLFMLLASLYAFALYAPEVWQRLGAVALCAGLAFAVWQKFRDGAPYLLDPDARPPKRIGLAHGMVATLVFFTLQFLFMQATLAVDGVRESTAILVGYAVAGILLLVVAIPTYYALSDRELDALPREAPPWGVLRSLTAGIGVGTVIAVIGCGWVVLVHSVEPFRSWHESVKSHDLTILQDRIQLLILAVVFAPVTEEVLFRRLIFGTMRRSVGFVPAALLSATMFTLVHHPISMLPVFVIGLATAWIYERTGRLAAPIFVHVVYNALVVGANIALS
jgi:membrane protease YdiL (CAAX protease family)